MLCLMDVLGMLTTKTSIIYVFFSQTGHFLKVTFNPVVTLNIHMHSF